MYSLQMLDLDTLIHQAQTMAIKDGYSRHIGNFGGYAVDANKTPIIFQVQVTIKEVGGAETRTESHYYFVPTSQPDQALAIAKAMATLDFAGIPYPLMSDRSGETQDATAAQSEVSEEVGPELSESEESEQPASEKPKQKRTRLLLS